MMGRVVILAASFGLLAGCNIGQPPLVAACSEKIVQRLKVPSSYKMLEHSIAADPMPRPNFVVQLDFKGVRGDEREKALQAFDSGAGQPTDFRITIRYEAENAFRARLRGVATCIYKSESRDAIDVKSWKMEMLP